MEIYTARAGDSPASVARRFGGRPEELTYINQLGDPQRLTAGLPLLLPGEREPPRRGLELGAVLSPAAPESVLKELLPGLSFVCLFCQTIGPEGLLPIAGEERLLALAAEAGAIALLTVTNTDAAGNYDAALAHAALGSETARQSLLDSILSGLEGRAYGGVCLYLGGLYPFDRDNYSAFLALAAPALHERGLYLTTAVPPVEENCREGLLCAAYDYEAHGRYADRVTILAFDWGHALSAPQAVSPLDRVRSALDYAAGKLSPGKTHLAIAMSGYDWRLPWRVGDRASPVGNARAVRLAIANRAEIKQDTLSRGSYFLYTDPLARRHVVWFDGPASVAARLRLAEEYGLAGLSLIAGARLWRPALRLLQSRYGAEKFF